MWVGNRSKGGLCRSGKSWVNVISSSAQRSIQVGKRSGIGRRWLLGVEPTSFQRRDDVQCGQAKGRKYVKNGIRSVGKTSAHRWANVFFTSTEGSKSDEYPTSAPTPIGRGWRPIANVRPTFLCWLGWFCSKKTRKIGKGNLYLTKNQLSRNEICCVLDNYNYMSNMCEKEFSDSNFI